MIIPHLPNEVWKKWRFSASVWGISRYFLPHTLCTPPFPGIGSFLEGRSKPALPTGHYLANSFAQPTGFGSLVQSGLFNCYIGFNQPCQLVSATHFSNDTRRLPPLAPPPTDRQYSKLWEVKGRPPSWCTAPRNYDIMVVTHTNAAAGTRKMEHFHKGTSPDRQSHNITYYSIWTRAYTWPPTWAWVQYSTYMFSASPLS